MTLRDAENIMIPHMRAKHDGDSTHDQITWLFQKETRMPEAITTDLGDGEFGVSYGEAMEATFILCMLNVKGIMFFVKNPIPDEALLDKQTMLRCADAVHYQMLHDLRRQMGEFVVETQQHMVALGRLLREADTR